MNRSTTARPKFLSAYILFSLIFLGALLLLIFLSNRLIPTAKTPMPTEKPPLPRPTVVIDAGHGGEDGGAIGTNGICEKELNLKIAVILEQKLKESDIEVVMTRSEDILLYDKNSDYRGQKKVQDLANRKKIAEQYENAIFVSIHMNSFPEPKYSGLQVYYSLNDPRSLTLAQEIQSVTKEALMPSNERKVKPTNGNLYLLDRLQTPAVLIECGFLSNPEECARLSDEKYQQELAHAISLALCNYFSKSYQNPNVGS